MLSHINCSNFCLQIIVCKVILKTILNSLLHLSLCLKEYNEICKSTTDHFWSNIKFRNIPNFCLGHLHTYIADRYSITISMGFQVPR
jgi:hypothetical protein